MGQPVVHFEIVGLHAEKLQGYYSALFGWGIDADNQLSTGPCRARGTSRPTALGSAAASERGRRGTPATSPSTSRCPTWRPRS